MLYDSVEAVDREVDYAALFSRGDPWPAGKGVSVRNVARQMRSAAGVTRLWLPRAAEYRLVVYLRPDVLFTGDMDLPRLAPRLSDSTIATPYWHKFGGLNDRFAFGNPRPMAAYGLRGAAIPAYMCLGHPPHTEALLLWYAGQLGLANVDSVTPFVRVRATGTLAGHDP